MSAADILIEDAIYELIKVFAEGKVYLTRAESGDAGPFVVYKLNDGVRWRSINKQSDVEKGFIQIDSYAEKYRDARKLGRSIEKAIVDYNGTMEIPGSPPYEIKIAGVSFENDVMLLDQEEEPYLHRHSAIYQVTYYT